MAAKAQQEFKTALVEFKAAIPAKEQATANELAAQEESHAQELSRALAAWEAEQWRSGEGRGSEARR